MYNYHHLIETYLQRKLNRSRKQLILAFLHLVALTLNVGYQIALPHVHVYPDLLVLHLIVAPSALVTLNVVTTWLASIKNAKIPVPVVVV